MAAALRIVSHGAQHAPPRTKTDIVPQTLEEPMKRKVMISRKQIELDEMKALWATFVSIISIIVLREVDPWLNRTDGKVAYAGQWLVFFWIFAMSRDHL